MSLKDDILKAAKATHIPEGESGLWRVNRLNLTKPLDVPRERGKRCILPPGPLTQLFCYVEADAMNNPYGELVMDDTDRELKKHLNFMLRAHGRVLITGLGLGCVVRGCLANPAVKYVVCIERDMNVVKLVGPHMPKERLTIVLANALTWVNDHAKDQKFDCAWHDLWTNPDQKEPHLDIWHSQLVCDSIQAGIGTVGAWDFKREYRRLAEECLGQPVL